MVLITTRRFDFNRLMSAPRRVMKVSLIVSFFIHIIILIAFQSAFPMYWQNTELRTYMIEMIRPPIENTGDVDVSGATLDHLKGKEESIDNQDQDTISLDTKDKRYVSYAHVIKKEIMQPVVPVPSTRSITT